VERRKHLRLYGAYPVRVRGADASGRHFDATSLVDNVGSGGLYLQLPRSVGVGARLVAVVRLTGGLRIAARGHVLREEARGYGLSGVGVRFTKTRMLPSNWGKSAPQVLDVNVMG
jgi:PilZ domain-containing protein